MNFLERKKVIEKLGCSLMASSILILAGCGGIPVTTSTGTIVATNSGGSTPYYEYYNPNQDTKPTPTPTPTNTPSNSTPPLKFSFDLAGTRGSGTNTYPKAKTFTNINTDTVLKVTVNANQTGSISKTGYSFFSDCFTFDVALNDLAPQTVTVKTGSTDGTGYCYGIGQASPTVDFSSQLAHGQTTALSLTISNVKSTTCGPTSYCGYNISALQNLYFSYVASGSISVQVDGTR